jgi:hypothetical protein
MEKIVYLKRAIPFVHEAMNTEVMQSQLAQTQRSIGAYYVGEHNKKIGTGLIPDEEDLLIPILLQVRIDNHVEYAKAKFDHYNDIVTKVPGGKVGLALNIGLNDNDKPLGRYMAKTPVEVKYRDEKGEEQVKIEEKEVVKYNLPDNIEDYTRWRHAIGYIYTAPSVEAAKGNPLIQYYIEDPKRVIESNYKELQTSDDAYTEYVKVKNDPKQVDMLLTVLRTYVPKKSGRPPVNVNNLSAEERIMLLKEVAVQRPEIFYKYATDSTLKKRYFIEELQLTGLVTRIGTTFVDSTDNNYNLGDSVPDVVQNLWNPKETSRLNRLKAEYDGKKNKNKVLA